LAHEVGAALKAFLIEKLVLNQPVHGFHIALPGAVVGWDAAVIGPVAPHHPGPALTLGVLLKLAALVGLPDQGRRPDFVTGQVAGGRFRHGDGDRQLSPAFREGLFI
jgi:hypothetical protein